MRLLRSERLHRTRGSHPLASGTLSDTRDLLTCCAALTRGERTMFLLPLVHGFQSIGKQQAGFRAPCQPGAHGDPFGGRCRFYTSVQVEG